jgi:hypothetical protein
MKKARRHLVGCRRAGFWLSSDALLGQPVDYLNGDQERQRQDGAVHLSSFM